MTEQITVDGYTFTYEYSFEHCVYELVLNGVDNGLEVGGDKAIRIIPEGSEDGFAITDSDLQKAREFIYHRAPKS